MYVVDYFKYLKNQIFLSFTIVLFKFFIVNELNVKLIEAEEKISSLNRVVEAKNREINELKNTEKVARCKIEELQEEVRNLKFESEKKKRLFQSADNEKVIVF